MLNNPFYFIRSFKSNFINSNLKIIRPNKHTTILFEEKMNENNKKKLNSKVNIRLFYNKRNINKSKIIKKSSTANIFPPLLNKNKKYSIDVKFIRNNSEKDKSEKKSKNNSHSKDNFISFRLTNSKKNLTDNIFKDKNKKIKIINIKKSFKIINKNEDLKTTNNFNYPSNFSNLFLSSIKSDVNISSGKTKNFFFQETIKLKKIFKNHNKKISKSSEKNGLKKIKQIIINKEENNKNDKIKEIRDIFRLKKNQILTERKIPKLKYCIFPGNNSKLIEEVMKYRNVVWEKMALSNFIYSDFVWSPLTSSIDFRNSQLFKQCVNHIQLNEEISNKMRLYANLLRHCEKKGIDLYKIFPFTICLTLSHHSFEEQINNFKLLFKEINKYTPKSDITFSSLFNALLNKKIGSHQTINIPNTFNSGKNMWIIKPVNLNRGRCIKVLNDLNLILKEMKSIQNNRKILITEGNFYLNKPISYADKTIKTNSNFYPEKYYNNGVRCDYIMIQKYLEKPLLYQDRKFDIRIWVMFMTNRENEVYIFKEGHLKASSLKYNSDSNDLFVHLTNYSVQKHNINFSKIEIGNEIPFSEFQNDLDRKKTGKNFRKDIYPKIVRIIRLTGGAAKIGKMNFMNVKNCFEIFGYDFILDQNYKPYLLEVNSNPGLEISSPLINQLLPRMIDDAFKLTIDEIFSLSSDFINQKSRFPVDNYNNDENLWEKYSII